jgi:hypothetical protein
VEIKVAIQLIWDWLHPLMSSVFVE